MHRIIRPLNIKLQEMNCTAIVIFVCYSQNIWRRYAFNSLLKNVAIGVAIDLLNLLWVSICPLHCNVKCFDCNWWKSCMPCISFLATYCSVVLWYSLMVTQFLIYYSMYSLSVTMQKLWIHVLIKEICFTFSVWSFIPILTI